MVEVIVGDKTAVRFAAELSEFLLVDFLEQRALIPARAGEELQVAIELHLADVHHANFKRGVGLRIEDEIVQSPPGAFELLELRRMDDFVHLLGQFFVEPGDHLLDRVDDVAFDDA